MGGKHKDTSLREYVDWNKGKTFTEEPIQIGGNTHRIAQIWNYVHTERRRKAEIRPEQGLSGTITHILGKWETRQLEAALKKLQEAADNNDMQPIWGFQNKLRMGKTANHVAIKNRTGLYVKEWGKR